MATLSVPAPTKQQQKPAGSNFDINGKAAMRPSTRATPRSCAVLFTTAAQLQPQLRLFQVALIVIPPEGGYGRLAPRTWFPLI